MGIDNQGTTSFATIGVTASQAMLLPVGANDVIANLVVSGLFNTGTIDLTNIPFATNIQFLGKSGGETIILPYGPGDVDSEGGRLNISTGGGVDEIVIYGGDTGSRNLRADDIINTGAGEDTLLLAGDVDISAAGIAGVENLVAVAGEGSSVTMSVSQLLALQACQGDSDSGTTLRLVTQSPVTLSLNQVSLPGVTILSIGAGVTVEMSVAQYLSFDVVTRETGDALPSGRVSVQDSVENLLNAGGLLDVDGMVSVPPGTSVQQILQLREIFPFAVIDGSSLLEMDGFAWEVVIAYQALDTKPADFDTVITGWAGARDLRFISEHNGSGTVNATAVPMLVGRADEVKSVIDDASIQLSADYEVHIAEDDGVLEAGLLSAIVSATFSMVHITDAVLIQGSAQEVTEALVTERVWARFTNVEVIDEISVDAVGLIAARTGGVVTATLSDRDASTLALLAETNNAYAITVEGSADAVDLIRIYAATSSTVNASGVTQVTGTLEAFEALLSGRMNGEIDLAANFDAAISEIVTVDQANALSAETDGVVTAVLLERDASVLAALVEEDNAYTISVIGEATAEQLNRIDAATQLLVDATEVGSISGSGDAFETLIMGAAAETASIALPSGFVATLTGAATAAQLNMINGATTVQVNAEALTSISGSASDFAALIAASSNGEIKLAANFEAIATEPLTVAQVNALAALTDWQVTAVIVENDASLLVGLREWGNYTITVSGPTDASVFLQLLNLTAVQIDATGVTSFTGASSDVQSVMYYSMHGIANFLLAPDVSLTVTGPSAGWLHHFLENTVGSTTGHVDATGITIFSGWYELYMGLRSYIEADRITVGNFIANVAGAGVSVAQANEIAAMTNGYVESIITDQDAATLVDLTGTGNEYLITVAGAATAEQLIAIDAKTTFYVNAQSVTSITGSAEDFRTLLASASGQSPSIALGANFAAIVNDGLSVEQANTLSAKTDGVVSATILEKDATALALLAETGNAYAITVEGPADAADLIKIYSSTSLPVNASGVMTITGTSEALAALLAARASGEIDLAQGFDVTVTAPATVEMANAIAAETDGVVTAEISDHDATVLAALEDTGNAYTISVVGVATAEQLNHIDTATTLSVDAIEVTSISDSGNAFQTLIGNAASQDPSISLSSGFTATVTGSATAAQLNMVNVATTMQVDAAALTSIAGSASEFADLIAGSGNNEIKLSADFAAIATGTLTVAQAKALAALTQSVVTAEISDADPAVLASLVANEEWSHNYKITVDVTEAQVSQLKLIMGATTQQVDATAVRSIIGSASDVAFCVDLKSELALPSDVALTITGYSVGWLHHFLGLTNLTTGVIDATAVKLFDSTDLASVLSLRSFIDDGRITVSQTFDLMVHHQQLTVLDANEIDAVTAGFVMARISDQDAATLVQLNGVNQYTLIVSGDATAEQLNIIDAKTTYRLDARTVASHWHGRHSDGSKGARKPIRRDVCLSGRGHGVSCACERVRLPGRHEGAEGRPGKIFEQAE